MSVIDTVGTKNRRTASGGADVQVTKHGLRVVVGAPHDADVNIEGEFAFCVPPSKLTQWNEKEAGFLQIIEDFAIAAHALIGGDDAEIHIRGAAL